MVNNFLFGKFIKQKNFIRLIVFLILSILLLNFWWLVTDQREITRAEIPKLISAYCYSETNSGDSNCAGYLEHEAYGPGYFFISTKLPHLLGLNFNYKMSVFINSVYVILSLAGVFLIMNSILGCSYGLLAILFLTGFPIFIYAPKKFIIEVGLMPCVIWSVYILMLNSKWNKFVYSILFGVISGIGLLFKFSFLIYIIGPLGISVIHALNVLKNNKVSFDDNSAKFLKIKLNLFIAIIATGLVVGIWYFLHFNYHSFLFGLKEHCYEDAPYLKTSYLLFLKYNLRIILMILVKSISWLFLCGSVLCIILKWSKINKCFNGRLLAAWLITPLLILVFFPGDLPFRYLLPVFAAIPPLVLMAVKEFESRIRRWLFIIIIVISISNVAYETFIYRPAQKEKNNAIFLIEKICPFNDTNNKNISIAFNGVYDSKNFGEIEDIYSLFWAYKIYYNISYKLKYIKDVLHLADYLNYDYVISQNLNINNFVHKKLVDNGYNIISQFKYYYHEDIDPMFDWESKEYLIFKKHPVSIK